MFTWICPQCGWEVLPSQDECPRCAKAAKEAAEAKEAQPQAVVEPVVAAPAPVAAAPVAPAPVPAPAPVVAPVPVVVPAAAPVVAQAAPVATAPAPAVAAPYTPSYLEPPAPKSTGLRDILVTLGVAAVLLGGGYYMWTRSERAEKVAAEAKAGQESAAGRPTHPLAKAIEVTGIRLRIPKPGQAEVQLVVVNHSAAEIASISMDVVLMGKGTNKEVAVFPVAVKRLGPFGSSEVTAKAKTLVSAIDLPDWQFLESKVVVQANEP